jgi:sec-independent protein translocase protein TatB
MFDLTSSKLLILAVVALIVVGPKDLPALLRTLGRYMGMIRRQANEFRAQFDEAMRESELADLKKEVESIGRDTQETLRDATQSVETHLGDVTREVNESLSEVDKAALQQPALLDTASTEQAPDGLPPPQPIESTPQPVAPPAAQPRVTAEAASERTGA